MQSADVAGQFSRSRFNPFRRLLAMTDRNPWGNDAYSALRWAFSRLSVSGALPTALGTVHHSGGRVGLTRADLHAQASMIRDVACGTDSPIHAAYITAYFLGPPSLERLAGGGLGWVDRYHDERAAAVNEVALWLMGASGTGVHRIRGYRELVMQYTMGRPNNARLRELMKVRNSSIVAVRERAYSKLDELHEHALAAAARRLEQAGLI